MNEEEVIKKMLQDELEKQAKEIIQEINSDEALKDISLPKNMDKALRLKIKRHEEDAIKNRGAVGK